MSNAGSAQRAMGSCSAARRHRHERAARALRGHQSAPALRGVRDLKAYFSAYLRRVRDGETVTIPDRGAVIAQLTPQLPPEDALERTLLQLERAGQIALLLADLGVTRSHNSPHTSNDNPFSESHFKTLKYQPQFPKRFGCIRDAKAFCRAFFKWYNDDHHHLGIGLMTPNQVHYGQADDV